MKELACILIHVRKIFNCRVPFKILLFMYLIIALTQQRLGNFRIGTSEKIPKQWRKSLLSKYPLLALLLNRKIKMNTQNTMASLCHSKFRSTQNNGITLLSCLSHGACFGKGSIHSCQPSSIAREIHAFLTYLTPASRLVFFLTRNSSLTFHK